MMKEKFKRGFIAIPQPALEAVKRYVKWHNKQKGVIQKLTIGIAVAEAIANWCTFCPECNNQNYSGICQCKKSELL
jgi:hypothetical protein